MSILGRGIITIEGVMAVCSPQVNFMQIMAHNVSGNLLKQFDIKQALLVMGNSGFRLGRVYHWFAFSRLADIKNSAQKMINQNDYSTVILVFPYHSGFPLSF